MVTIPAGTLPLYNATVYIPNAPVGPLAQGASCQRCDMENSGSPIVTTHTDVDGHFVLRDVPAGADIPVVVTLGKWRRQLTIPAVAACTDNPVSAEATRLPRRQSEGDIPRIAIVTSTYDPTECILNAIGIDAAEFNARCAEEHRLATAARDTLQRLERYDEVPGPGVPTVRGRTHWLLADLALRRGDVAAALRECDAALDAFTIAQHTRWQGNTLLRIAEVYAALGATGDAIAAAEQAQSLFSPRDAPTRVAAAALVRARLQLAQRDYPAAQALAAEAAEVFAAREAVLDLHFAPELERYLVELVLASRDARRYDATLARRIAWGASPRGSIALERCARARAWLAGRDYVTPEDIHAIAPDVLRHRVLPSYEATAEGWDGGRLVGELLQRVPLP